MPRAIFLRRPPTAPLRPVGPRSLNTPCRPLQYHSNAQVIHADQHCKGPQLRLYLLFTDIVNIINCSTTQSLSSNPEHRPSSDPSPPLGSKRGTQLLSLPFLPAYPATILIAELLGLS
jgi:hypothetical protein